MVDEPPLPLVKCRFLLAGGSLFNLLDDPENNFGLDEDEWLLVLSHLSAGMNHLRDNNLVHR